MITVSNLKTNNLILDVGKECSREYYMKLLKSHLKYFAKISPKSRVEDEVKNFNMERVSYLILNRIYNKQYYNNYRVLNYFEMMSTVPINTNIELIRENIGKALDTIITNDGIIFADDIFTKFQDEVNRFLLMKDLKVKEFKYTFCKSIINIIDFKL